MTAPTSIWSTLRHAPFRALWQAGGLYFLGNAMQVMAAAWMMVELNGSSFLAALVQTAVFLPMFLLSLPAGVLADITDRRRLIVASLAVQAVAIMATLAYSAVASYALLRGIGWASALAAAPKLQGRGLDIELHGEEAYSSGEGAILVLPEQKPMSEQPVALPAPAPGVAGG